jgi:hypothetical protein
MPKPSKRQLIADARSAGVKELSSPSMEKMAEFRAETVMAMTRFRLAGHGGLYE